MKKYTESILPGRYYHVFNRSINREPLFLKPDNYVYFMKKFYLHLGPVSDIFCYCLLENHFHFLLRTKTEEDIKRVFKNRYKERSADFILSKQFSNFFNGYAQAFNKMSDRTGGLFEEPFRRKEITTEAQLAETILYIHLNPVKHKLSIDYTTYPYSSYSSILNASDQRIQHQFVVQFFGNLEEFVVAHAMKLAMY